MEKLETFDLFEIKLLCKKYNINPVGTKKMLIKNLNYFFIPVVGTLNTHSGRKLLDGKKIVGIKTNEKEKLNKTLKNKGLFLYYSFGYNYYLVGK